MLCSATAFMTSSADTLRTHAVDIQYELALHTQVAAGEYWALPTPSVRPHDLGKKCRR